MTANHYRAHRLGRAILATTIAALCTMPGRGQFEITTATGNTSQNFDTLANTGTTNPFTNDTTLTPGDSTLDGWSLFGFTGAGSMVGPVATYRADTGSSTNGAVYSYGPSGGSDRALGGIGSNALSSTGAAGGISYYFTFAATNNSTATLTSFTLQYDGEQWRNGGNATPQSMTVQYGFGASFDLVVWNTPGGSFDWTSPVASATAAAVDGNTTGLVAGRGGTINGLDWATGQTLWLRWIDVNDAGNDHGLALDNFAFSWVGASIVPLYWDVNGALPGIGGSGTWSASDPGNVNWNPAATGDGTPQNSDATKRLVFGGPGGLISIDSAVAANIGMKFEASYNIGGGLLTLGSIPTIDTDAAATVTLASALAGTAGLTKLGPGTLILTNPTNPFQGTITISGGALSVGADGHFGNAANSIALNGGLLTFSTGFTLAPARGLTGNGALHIPAGQTVTAQGTVNLSAVEISSGDTEHDEGGTLTLAGAANTLGSLTLNDPATLTSPTGLTLGGNVTVAASVTGASRILAPVTLASGVPKFTIPETPALVDFLIDGALTGAGRLHKVGNGTLRLTGLNTSFPGGVRLGTAGTVTEPGGRLIIGDKNALGTSATLDFQFNDGTLESEVPLTGTNALPVGVSFGAGQLGPGTFAGQPFEFLGDLSLFRPATTTLEHKLHLETDVTFRGFAQSQGTGSSIGLAITGNPARTFTFSGTAATVSTEALNLDGPTLVVNGALTGATIAVRAGTLRGPGPLGGILTIGDGVGEDDATLEPGAGLGTLVLGGLGLLADARLRFELDLTALTSDRIEANGPVDLGPAHASAQFLFLNPAIVPLGTAFTLIDNTAFGFTTGTFAGLPEGATFLFAGNQFAISYTAGPDFNDVVLTVVPEPSAAALLVLGALGLVRRRRECHSRVKTRAARQEILGSARPVH
jgi:autotransporter-associated beta strand protein